MNYTVFDYPVRVYGIPQFSERKKLERFPDELRKKLYDFHAPFGNSMTEHIMTRTPGARAAFRTDSENITVTMKLKTLEVDSGMSKFACSSAAVYTGKGENLVFRGLVIPSWDDKTGDLSFRKSRTEEDVMIFFPRNEIVENIIISIDENSRISEPTGYKYEKPVIFFGSSITEGGHAALVTNAYTALLSSRLDFEYYNFGLSGSCLGQTDIAEYICSLSPSVLVYDYDHNAFSAEYLEKTHEAFFRYIRSRMPHLPVIFMSAPDYDYIPEADERRKIIRNTYERAVSENDTEVYFIDGKHLFGECERQLCTTDRTHPNDLGFHRMADVIEPVLRKILENLNA